jgi:hypothetical protein
MEKKQKQTKKRVTELYQFMRTAKMTKLNDEEKIFLIRLLRKMKPVAVEVMDAINVATDKAMREYPDDATKAAELTQKAMEDMWNDEADIDIRVLSHNVIDKLAISNEWTFSTIDEIECEFCAG